MAIGDNLFCPDGWGWDTGNEVWIHLGTGVKCTLPRDASKDQLDAVIDKWLGNTDMATPSFTKKHYEVLAEVLRNSVVALKSMEGDTSEMQLGAGVVISGMVDLFTKDNPRFRKADFLKALSKETK